MQILEAFGFTLGLDKSGYEKGSREVRQESAELVDTIQTDNDAIVASDKKRADEETKRHRDQRERQKQTREGFSGVKREVLGLMAVLVGANSLKDYVASTTVSIAAMGRAAKVAGLDTRDLAAFGKMIERNGGQAETAQASLVRLAQVMTQWRTLGQVDASTVSAFSYIGAGPSDDPLEVYKKFAAWAGTQDAQLVAQVGGQLGFDEAAIDQAMKGRAAADAALKDAYRNTPTEADVKRIQDLLKAWNEFKQSVKGAADELLYEAAPALTNILTLITNGIRDFPEFTKAVLALGAAFTVLGGINMASGALGFLGRLAGGGTAAAGGGAAASAAAGGGLSRWIAGAARWTPWLGAAIGILTPTEANAGEDEILARARASGYNTLTPRNGQIPTDVRGRQAYAKKFFTDRGWSNAEASGIVAGMTAENGALDVRAHNRAGGGRGARGLGQWRAGRLDDFKARYGKDVLDASMDEQLAFMHYELTAGKEKAAGNKIRGATGQRAMEAYILNYMRPAPGYETTSDLARGGRALAATTSINTVNIYATPGTDGAQVGRDFKKELLTPRLTTMSNSGIL